MMSLNIVSYIFKHFGFPLLLGMYTCALSHFSHVLLFATLWTIARQAPLSMGFSGKWQLQWVAMPSSRGSSQPRDRSCVSYVSSTGGWVFHSWATGEAFSRYTFHVFCQFTMVCSCLFLLVQEYFAYAR